MMVKDRLLVLLQILQEHTDDETWMTTAEILDRMAKEGQEGCIRTLRRNIVTLRNCGYDIGIRETNGGPTEYAWLGRDWSMPELRILVDAVAAAQFLSPEKSRKLIAKLSGMAGPSHADELKPRILVSENVKAKNNYMIYTVDAIRKAIDRDKKITFRYLQYDEHNKGTASGREFVSKSTFLDMQIDVIEDKNIQKRIGKILSEYDLLLETNQRQIKLLEEAAQRLYKEWFVDRRYPGHENAPVVDGVPEGWEKKTVGELCEKTRDTVSPNDIPPGTPYIGLEHIPRHDFCLSEWGNASDVTSSKTQYKRNDIIFGQIRPYFHKVGFAITDGVASTDSFIMTPSKDIWGLFLMTVFSEAFVNFSYQTCKEGAKMPRADWNQMKQYPIIIADTNTQQAFEGRIRNIAEEVRILALQNKELSEARDRLLPKLMSGEIAV